MNKPHCSGSPNGSAGTSSPSSAWLATLKLGTNLSSKPPNVHRRSTRNVLIHTTINTLTPLPRHLFHDSAVSSDGCAATLTIPTTQKDKCEDHFHKDNKVSFLRICPLVKNLSQTLGRLRQSSRNRSDAYTDNICMQQDLPHPTPHRQYIYATRIGRTIV